jgi:nitroreductase
MDDTPLMRKEAQIFAHLAEQRRATQHFRDEPVPDSVIETALAIASQAPSGYNLQPWRFLVLTSPERRAKLRQAAFDQEKITEAPCAIIAFGEREGWKQHVDAIFHTSTARRGVDPSSAEKIKAGALGFISHFDPALWLNRHVMIAFTYLMLAFESLGWDTAPMEGFDADAVKKAFELPNDAEVVALLAVGHAKAENAHPGRLTVDHIAYRERYGEPLLTDVHYGPKSIEVAPAIR